MKKLLILVSIMLTHFCLKAQNTIGKSKEDIRKIIQSNPNFKLLAGDSCDTLSFPPVMATIFLYKNNICYKSVSVLPLQYMSTIIEKMTTDSYKKIDENTWIDAEETIKVSIAVDKIKNVFSAITTSYDKVK